MGIGAKKIRTRANDKDEERKKREETRKKRHLPLQSPRVHYSPFASQFSSRWSPLSERLDLKYSNTQYVSCAISFMFNLQETICVVNLSSAYRIKQEVGPSKGRFRRGPIFFYMRRAGDKSTIRIVACKLNLKRKMW